MRPVALFGLTTTLNTAACCATLMSLSTGQNRNEQVVGAAVDLYGSDVHDRSAASPGYRRAWPARRRHVEVLLFRMARTYIELVYDRLAANYRREGHLANLGSWRMHVCRTEPTQQPGNHLAVSRHRQQEFPRFVTAIPSVARITALALQPRGWRDRGALSCWPWVLCSGQSACHRCRHGCRHRWLWGP